MTPNHHPHPDTLISYVAGTLPNAISCVVACHLSMCAECTGHARWLEMLGGLMLKNLEPAPADTAFTERAAAHWSGDRQPASEPRGNPALKIYDPLLPLPLASYLGVSGREIQWEPVGTGVRQYWVKLPKGSGQMRLLRLPPGKLLLEHAHSGMELTLVLQGTCRDHTGDYIRGDVIEWAEGSLHQLRASGNEECVCLISSDVRPADLARDHGAARQPRRKAISPTPRVRNMWDFKPALVAGSLLVGIGLGWVLRGTTAGNAVSLDDLVQIESNRLIALGPLRTGLETLPSTGHTASILSQGRRDIQVGIKMTFKNQAGDYCREYRIASGSAGRHTGVACRTGDQWAVKIQALLPPSHSASEQTMPAGGADSAMDTAVGALIDGDPLADADEAALLSRGWKN